MFEIDADQFSWICGPEDDSEDLCLHGHVTVQIGKTVMEYDGTVSATADVYKRQGKKFTLPEVNERINELLKSSIKSEGVINLFSDVQAEFSLFDPKFLEEIANMKRCV